MKIKNQKGQGMIEYLIIVALVGVAAIGIVRIVGHNVGVQYANIAKALGGQQGEQAKAENVQRGDYDKRDLSDFMKGSVSSSKSEKQD